MLSLASLCIGQSGVMSDAGTFAAEMARYEVHPNIVYHTANNYEAKLDLYTSAESQKPSSPTPVVLVIHGGGWIAGSKEERVLEMMPYLQMGFAAVNVEYRLAKSSLAPAAVEDCRCALHWVFANAKKYNFDPSRVVLQGGSAGGHLVLTTGMLTPKDGFDNQCWTDDEDYWSKSPGTNSDPKVAAIVNWFGIADVLDELHGANAKGYAVVWLGNQPSADEIAKRVSPINYVNRNNPPIITIHGDKDTDVPVEQSRMMSAKLEKQGVEHQLNTIAGAEHGLADGDPQNVRQAYEAAIEFLKKHL